VNGWRRKQAKNANFRGCNSVDFRRAHGLIIKSNKLCNCPVREAFCDRTADDKNALEPRHVSILRLSPSTDRNEKSFKLLSGFSFFFLPFFCHSRFASLPVRGQNLTPDGAENLDNFKPEITPGRNVFVTLLRHEFQLENFLSLLGISLLSGHLEQVFSSSEV
jgi:hypothetical protein